MEDLDRRLEDERPDVLEVLKSMNWEERLEKARARRETVLARKAASSKRPAIRGREAANLAGRPDPAVLPSGSSGDIPPQIDERVLRGQTPAVSPGLPEAGTADTREMEGAASAPLLDEAPIAQEAPAGPAAAPSLASRIGSGFGFGLGIGLSLVFGAVLLTRLYPGLVPIASDPPAAAQPFASAYAPVPPVVAESVTAWRPALAPETPVTSRGPLAGPVPVALADPWEGGAAAGGPVRAAALSQAPVPRGADLVAAATGGPVPASSAPFRPVITEAELAEARAGHDMPPAAVAPADALAPAVVSSAPVLAALTLGEGDISASLAGPDAAPEAHRVALRPGEPDPTALPGVDARPPETGPAIPGADRVRVFLSAPSTLSGNAVEGVANGITESGIAMGEIRQVGFKVSETQVRFFHEADAMAAAALAEFLGARARDFTGFRPSPPDGTLEVYLAGEAAARPPRATAPPPPSEAELLRDRIVQRLRRGEHL